MNLVSPDLIEQCYANVRDEASVVTVVVSLYNYREYVVSCLDSVCSQRLSGLDLIVVDDASSDGGTDVGLRWMQQHGGRFGRVSLLRHRRNFGLAAARNTGFERALTPRVFVLDCDNLLYPRCLQQLSRALDHCTASFAYCYLELFGAARGLQNLSTWRPDSLATGNRIDAMVLLRREAWEAAGGYSPDMPVMGWEDFDLWFKLARLNRWGVQVPEILARYRVRRDSMIRTVTNPNVHLLWDHLRLTYPEFFADDGRANDGSAFRPVAGTQRNAGVSVSGFSSTTRPEQI